MKKYIAILLLAFSGSSFAACYEATNFTGVHADSDYDYSLNSVDLWNVPTKRIVLDGLNSNVDGEDRDCNQVAEYMLMCMSQSGNKLWDSSGAKEWSRENSFRFLDFPRGFPVFSVLCSTD